MRPELEEIQLLEDFLEGKLGAEQEQDIGIRLLWDQGWQQKVAQQQLAYHALRMAGREQLRRELQAMHQRLFG